MRGTTTTGIDDLVDVGNVTAFIDQDVENGRTYLYRVCAFTEIGDGAKTGMITVRPVGPPEAPMDVHTYAGGLVGDGKVSFTWMPPLNNGGMVIQGYRIWRGFTNGSLKWVADINRETFSYLDTGLDNGPGMQLPGGRTPQPDRQRHTLRSSGRPRHARGHRGRRSHHPPLG